MENHKKLDTIRAGPLTAVLRLRNLQRNVQGLRPKKHEVLQAIVKEDVDIVLLQEALMLADFEWLHLALMSCLEGRSPLPTCAFKNIHTSLQELQMRPSYSLYTTSIGASQRQQLEAGELLTFASCTVLS